MELVSLQLKSETRMPASVLKHDPNTQKVQKKRLFVRTQTHTLQIIRTQTHTLQICGVVPFVKPQHNFKKQLNDEKWWGDFFFLNFTSHLSFFVFFSPINCCLSVVL